MKLTLKSGLIFSLLVVFCFSLIVCDGSNKDDKKPTFVLCPKSLSNPYWFAVEKGMKDAAAKLDVNVEFLGPVQADVAQQVTIIESLIARKIDGLAISPNDPDGIKEIITRAMKNGIPTLTFDSDSPESQRIAYIGTDNYNAGREAGKQMIKYLNGEGKIAVLTGGLGALNLNQRIAGFRDVLKEENADIVEVALEACDDDNNRALNLMEDVSRSHPELDGWFVTGCWALISPKAAVMNALGNRNNIALVGFDTLDEELSLVKDGTVNALVGQRPYDMGYKCVEVLYDIVVNKKMPEKEIIDTGVDVVTLDNVDQFLSK
ncbi:sugar-binding protein [candidate division KSB1 bacterium]|nr:sugar-binding protein [candidate division KSB1 bacterium]